MSEEYNPQALVIEDIERLEVELKDLLRRRDRTTADVDRDLLQQEIDDLNAQLRYLRRKLD